MRGTGFDGRSYAALDPKVYAWVHLSNFDTTLAYHRWFAPLARAEQEQLYEEWRRVGRVLGIGDAEMPTDLVGCRDYVRDMVEHTLGDNETVHRVLGSLRLSGVEAPWSHVPDPAWRALRPLGGAFLHDATVGTLPARVRKRLGLRWSGFDRARLQAAAVMIRTGVRAACPIGPRTTRSAPAPDGQPAGRYPSRRPDPRRSTSGNITATRRPGEGAVTAHPQPAGGYGWQLTERQKLGAGLWTI